MISIIRNISDTLNVVVLSVYYYFEAFVLKFLCKPKDVTGEIVLVTGSASGLGRQIAVNFAHLGAVLILWDINEEGNKETAELTRKNGARAVYVYKCDVNRREEIYTVANQVKKEVGDVTILVNNAGILNRKTFTGLSDSVMERTINVNCEAHFWTCKAFLPAMIKSNHGHLVTIASAAGITGCNYLSDYSASKAACILFLECLAFEMWASGKTGIKTTIVCPYYMDTELTAGIKSARPFLLPILNVEHAGKKVVDAVLNEKSYLFIPSIVQLGFLKTFLPRKVKFLFAQYLGFFNDIDHFKG
uniref:Epidermal retinol dehydrogenase 2 n=1 Tax=Salvator merianae TaxID=96440 RepID=A0A8D0DUY3_SALMN